MRHTHYYRVKASTHFELGYKLGKLFKSPSLDTYHSILKLVSLNRVLLQNAHVYMEVTQREFPQYIEELKGYAKGIGVDFASFWLVFLNEELNVYPEKCTTVITNDGLLIGHNEDYDDHFKKRITILEKTIGNTSIIELFYYNSVGGTSCSVNSRGVAQTINTLTHTDARAGIPRNVIGRWLSETSNPKNDFEHMKKIVRSLGYCHNFGSDRGISFIEASAHAAAFTSASSPHVHTNHYLTSLKTYEEPTEEGNSQERFSRAKALAKNTMSVAEMKHVLEEVGALESNKARVSGTIARVVIDLAEKEWWCWLAREKSKGWIRYPIHFL